MNLNRLFISYCKKNNLLVNSNQIALIDELNQFYNLNFDQSFLKKYFPKKTLNLVFIYKAMLVLAKR